MTPEGKTLL
jgi:hypothetical protein